MLCLIRTIREKQHDKEEKKGNILRYQEKKSRSMRVNEKSKTRSKTYTAKTCVLTGEHDGRKGRRKEGKNKKKTDVKGRIGGKKVLSEHIVSYISRVMPYVSIGRNMMVE